MTDTPGLGAEPDLTPPPYEHDDLDGCDFTVEPGDVLPDAEADLFVLFADALDPDTPTTVEQRAAEWEALAQLRGAS